MFPVSRSNKPWRKVMGWPEGSQIRAGNHSRICRQFWKRWMSRLFIPLFFEVTHLFEQQELNKLSRANRSGQIYCGKIMGIQMTDAKISKQARAEALKIARGTQRPGQRKEQTKLIAQGIEKGITEFRKREKAKARERDKLRKKALKEPNSTQPQAEQTKNVQTKKSASWSVWIPWLLLLASWAYFLIPLRLLD